MITYLVHNSFQTHKQLLFLGFKKQLSEAMYHCKEF